MSEDSVRQTIRDHAKLSLLTDRVSEIQVKNLKMWPFVFFEAVSKATIDFDLSNDMAVDIKEDRVNMEPKYLLNENTAKNLRVSYHLTLDERLNGHLDKRFKAIEDSVRTVFWKQVKVEVYFNEKKVFESKDV